MTLSQRLKETDWIDVILWLFRAVIIILIVVGIVRKLFFGAGVAYSTKDWLDFITSGLSQGGLYALIALGYTMVYGVLFMINFAHGEFFMSGAMTSAILVGATLDSTGFLDSQPLISIILLIFVSVLTSMVVALLTERIAYRPLRRAPRLVPLITAIGASFFWQNLFRGFFGSAVKPYPVPESLEGRVNIMGFDFLKVRIVVLIASIIALIALYLFVQKTRTGKAIRAVAEDKDVATLMGIDVDRTIAITFAVGAFMAGIAAVLWGMTFKQVNFTMGFVPGIKAFTAAVLGGIGSIPGAALGGFFLGLIEAVGPPLILEGLNLPGVHQLKDVIAFTLLVLVLIFRPQGILGEKMAEKKA
ncbi:MAG: branched-chain amino acid ABC transporter permease [Anaerolineae bacterium]|nr:branched-chain amino acid ABC transporter permease [Anaerolineae bacterium]